MPGSSAVAGTYFIARALLGSRSWAGANFARKYCCFGTLDRHSCCCINVEGEGFGSFNIMGWTGRPAAGRCLGGEGTEGSLLVDTKRAFGAGCSARNSVRV